MGTTPRGGANRTELLGILTGSATALFVRGAGALAALAFNLLLARRLGADGLGLFTLAFTILNIAAVAAMLGLPLVVLRFVSMAGLGDAHFNARAVLRTANRWSIQAGLVLTALLLVAADPIARGLFDEPALTTPIRLICLGLMPLALVTIQGEALKGIRSIARGQLVQSVIGTVVALVLAGALLDRLTLNWAIACFVAGTWLAWGSGWWLWHRSTRGAKADEINRVAQHRAMRTAAQPLFISALLVLIMSFTDTVALGAWHDSGKVGAYFVAARLTFLSSMVLSAVSASIGPRFATLAAQGRRTDIVRLTKQSSLAMSAAALAINGCLIIFAPQLLELFGPEFRDAAPVLRILALGQFVVLATGPVSNLLVMAGGERDYRNAIALGAALNLAFNLALVPQYAGVGAAIGTATALAVQNLASMLFAWRRVLGSHRPASEADHAMSADEEHQ